MNAENKPKRLGEILIDEGVITNDQLEIALTEQKKVHEPLGKLLVNLGFATEAIMRSALGEALEQESVDLSRVVPDPPPDRPAYRAAAGACRRSRNFQRDRSVLRL